MPFTPVPAAGSKVRASVLSALFSERTPLYAVLTTSPTYTSLATPAAVLDLTLPVDANATFAFEFHLAASSAANAAGDIQYTLSFPAGATLDVHQSGPHNSLASGSQSDIETQALFGVTTSPTTSMPFGCSTIVAAGVLFGKIVVGATAGTLSLNAAQQVSNVNTTTLRVRSWAWGQRIA